MIETKFRTLNKLLTTPQSQDRLGDFVGKSIIENKTERFIVKPYNDRIQDELQNFVDDKSKELNRGFLNRIYRFTKESFGLSSFYTNIYLFILAGSLLGSLVYLLNKYTLNNYGKNLLELLFDIFKTKDKVRPLLTHPDTIREALKTKILNQTEQSINEYRDLFSIFKEEMIGITNIKERKMRFQFFCSTANELVAHTTRLTENLFKVGKITSLEYAYFRTNDAQLHALQALFRKWQFLNKLKCSKDFVFSVNNNY